MTRTRRFAIFLASALALAACREKATEHMTGTLERDRVELVVESNEPITAIHVADGARVAAGALILEQDPTRFERRRAQALALRDQATARLAELQRGPRKESIREAQAQLEAAKVLATNARREAGRQADLYERGLGSESARDDAQAQADEAEAQVTVRRESLAALLNGTTVEELEQSQAALRAADAALSQAELDVTRTRVLAPLAGTIDKVLYEVGERPAPGTTIAVLLDDARVFARVYVPAHWRALVRPGDTLNVALAGVGETLRGTVSWVSPEASFTPYFALTEHDRSRLSYLAEVELPQAADLPTGLPLQAWPPQD